jgi:hypothetical protein
MGLGIQSDQDEFAYVNNFVGTKLNAPAPHPTPITPFVMLKIPVTHVTDGESSLTSPNTSTPKAQIPKAD